MNRIVISSFRRRRAIFLLLVCCLFAESSNADREQSRAQFLLAEKTIAKVNGSAATREQSNQARELLAQLQDYSLVGYLKLALAERELDLLSDQQLSVTLDKYADLPDAYSLRRSWLARLAKDKKWSLILAYHRKSKHRPSACLEAQALWKTGALNKAWGRAKELWLTGASLPEECDAVLSAWRDAGQLSSELVWQRSKLAMAKGNINLAQYLRRFADNAHKALIGQWIALRAAPKGLSRFAKTINTANEDGQHIIGAVFERVSQRDLKSALTILQQLQKQQLPLALMSTLRDRISGALADKQDARADKWLKFASSSKSLRAQAINTLLRGQYQHLYLAINAMDEEQSQRERWRYWRTRALTAMDRGQEASTELLSLAKERSYYGFLAADDAQQGYRLGHVAFATDKVRLQALNEDARIIRVKEWLALDRSVEARREWRDILKAMDKPSQRDAALVAHSWQWHEGAIRAAAAATAWDDLDVRFPIAFHGDVLNAAQRSNLPASRIYAIARQESAFMQDIRSSAGALGLMQLMPATARQMARVAKQAKPNRAAILAPRNNLLLGGIYLSRLQRQYNTHPVLATAAYNAGPGRVRQWRTNSKIRDSRDWVEAIPFRETRRYVRRVLTYQIIYAQRLGEKPLRLGELMPPIKAR